jgi:hypothetical protein
MPAKTKRSNRHRKGPHYAYVCHRRERIHRICRYPRTPRNGASGRRARPLGRRRRRRVHRGALDDLDTLRAAAAEADCVIHLAFNNVSETMTADIPIASQRRP